MTGDTLANHWFFQVVLAIIPLVLLARARVFPNTRLIILMLIPCLLTLLLLIAPDALTSVILIDLAIAVTACGDLITLPASRRFAAERDVGRIASLDQPQKVEISLQYLSSRTASLTVRDDIPEQFEATTEQFEIAINRRSRVRLNYEFKAKKRGAYSLDCVHLMVFSKWRLWKRCLTIPVLSKVHVYPNMQQLSQYAVLARTNRLSLVGVRRSRKVGQDHDFERLRDYTPDDNHKLIDWRATARRHRLTVKQYQTSQSQRVVFLLDCGRMMNNQASGLSLLDHSLNSMLMLSHVALKQGDSVGLICFSDRVHTSVPPRGGMTQMNRLLHASFDRFPSLVESRYDLAFLHLAAHCRKRSLVILVSNVIDQVNSHQIEQYLGLQVGRHLPIGVLLRDHQLFDAADRGVQHKNDLFRAAAAAEILNWRHDVMTDLEHKGVMVMDLFPEDMTAPLINQYLDIKARHLL